MFNLRNRFAGALALVTLLAAAFAPPAAAQLAVGEAAVVWRDWTVNGVQSSGVWSPRKSDIRAWGRRVESGYVALQASQAGGGLAYDTRAHLNAVTAAAVGAQAWVYWDATPANNGAYSNTGTATAAVWTWQGPLVYAPSPVLSIGTVTTVGTGGLASASIGCATLAPCLDLVIPSGGPPNVLSIGTVTTGAAGSSATATITGTSPAQTLNLGIPKGDTGDVTPAATAAKVAAEAAATAAASSAASAASSAATATAATGGSSIVLGTGAPSNLAGANGQLYLDQVAFALYGPKASGSWPLTGHLFGSTITNDALLGALPSSPLAVWVADTYSATPQPNIPNLVNKTATVSSNLLRGGANQTWSAYWACTSATCTDAQTGPDGVTANATQVNGTSNWYYSYVHTTSWPIATYTLSFEAKSATGSSQQFKTAFLSSCTSATKTATTSWQTFSYTCTTTSTTSSILPIWSFDGSTAGNILIANLRLHAGSSDLGADPTAVGHLLLGKSNTVSVPSVAANAMDLSGSAGGIARFASTQTIGPVTIVAVAQKTASGAGGGFQTFASKAGVSGNTSPYAQFSAFFENYGTTATASQGAFANPSGGLWEPYNQGWHFYAHRADSTGSTLFLDDSKFAYTTTAYTPTTLDRLLVGSVNSPGAFSTNYKVAAIGVWPRALSDSEVATAYTALSARAAADSITMAAASNRVYVAEGDSISAATFSYAHVFGPNASPALFGSVFAISGSTQADLRSRASKLDAVLPASIGARKFVLSVMIGRNDLTTSYSGPGGTGVTGWLVDLAAYLDARRAAGWKTVCSTILPATLAGFNSARNTANTTIRTWVGTHCDALADPASDATMGIDGNGSSTGPWNTTYYSDGTHPTAAGHLLIEPYFRTAINGL